MSRAQQDALYAAERIAVAPGPELDPETAQDLVNNWLQGEMSDLNPWVSAIFIDMASGADIRLNAGHIAMAGINRKTGVGTITMCRPRISVRTLIHEVSHVLTDLRLAHGTAGHSEAFMRTYLEWVFRLRGTDEWMAFKKQLNVELEKRGVACVA